MPDCSNRHPLKYSRRAARTALLGFVLLLVSRAFADNSKISPDLQPLLANSSSKINVIVQYNTPPQQSSGGLLGGLVGGVLNLLGGVLNTVFSLIPAVSATMQPADILGVSNQSNVAYISLDRPVGRLARLHGCRGRRSGGMEFGFGRNGYRRGRDRQRSLQPPGFERGQVIQKPRGVPAELYWGSPQR
jgi:hypothetical protein